MKKTLTLLTVLSLLFSSVTFASEVKPLTLGFNELSPQFAVVNYRNKGLSTSTLESPRGYVSLSPSGVLDAPPSTPNTAPTAVISMSPSTGVTTVTAITWSHLDSTDLDNDQITEAEWRLDSGTVSTSPPAGVLPAGTHTVELRVRDVKGLWSDWVSETFTVVPYDPFASYNEATKLMTSNSSNGLVASANYWYTPYDYQPYKAFDNSLTTNWATGYQVMPAGGHWLMLDFGVAKHITALRYVPSEVRTNQYTVKSWILYGSNNASTFTQITSGTHDNSATPAEHVFENSASYRYYRFNITETYDSSGNTVGLMDLKYFE